MTTTDKPYLGRCKECDYALYATSDQLQFADNFSGVLGGAGAFRVRNSGVFARCPNRHKVFLLNRIKGTYSESRKCDARCMNAKGHECTCSCGGINHGRGYALTLHTQPELPLERQASTPPPTPAPPPRRAEEAATGPQITLINRLMEERSMDLEARREARRRLDNGLTKRQASAWITRLKELPRIGTRPA